MEDKKSRILFVEDDLSLGLVTRDSLELQGYEIKLCEDGLEGWKAFQKEKFDLCVLDVMLPKMDGFQLAKLIREKNEQIPILFLTAKSLQEDKITGLKLGADDYLTKPFSIEELGLKIEIFLRRPKIIPNPHEEKTFQIGQYQFDFENLSLIRGEEVRQLTLREAEVLRYFCRHLNTVVRRESILKEIWGQNDYFMGRSLDVFITRLRKYLRDDAQIKIENIPSVGFKMSLKD
ncbi:MAG: response regulator transcription factor [Microscillaceae bacterium]